MQRWLLGVGVLAAMLIGLLGPAMAACGTERRLAPNGKFETVPKQDCYPDLHSAPMSNAPPNMPEMPSMRCRTERERVLQPNGTFGYRQVEKCN